MLHSSKCVCVFVLYVQSAEVEPVGKDRGCPVPDTINLSPTGMSQDIAEPISQAADTSLKAHSRKIRTQMNAGDGKRRQKT